MNIRALPCLLALSLATAATTVHAAPPEHSWLRWRTTPLQHAAHPLAAFAGTLPERPEVLDTLRRHAGDTALPDLVAVATIAFGPSGDNVWNLREGRLRIFAKGRQIGLQLETRNTTPGASSIAALRLGPQVLTDAARPFLAERGVKGPVLELPGAPWDKLIAHFGAPLTTTTYFDAISFEWDLSVTDPFERRMVVTCHGTLPICQEIAISGRSRPESDDSCEDPDDCPEGP